MVSDDEQPEIKSERHSPVAVIPEVEGRIELSLHQAIEVNRPYPPQPKQPVLSHDMHRHVPPSPIQARGEEQYGRTSPGNTPPEDTQIGAYTLAVLNSSISTVAVLFRPQSPCDNCNGRKECWVNIAPGRSLPHSGISSCLECRKKKKGCKTFVGSMLDAWEIEWHQADPAGVNRYHQLLQHLKNGSIGKTEPWVKEAFRVGRTWALSAKRLYVEPKEGESSSSTGCGDGDYLGPRGGQNVALGRKVKRPRRG